MYKKEEDERPDSEIDILCIADEQLVCGEVKSASSEFTTDELKKLAKIAKELAADRAVIFAFRDENHLMERVIRARGENATPLPSQL